MIQQELECLDKLIDDFDFSKIEETFPGVDNLMDEWAIIEDLLPKVG